MPDCILCEYYDCEYIEDNDWRCQLGYIGRNDFGEEPYKNCSDFKEIPDRMRTIIMDNFEIKCKKCGSSDIKIVEYDDYDGNEEYCGSHYALRCKNCYQEEYIEGICD